MATAAAPAEPRHRTATLSAVELFAAGTFDGHTFGEDFLSKVVENHALLSTGPRPLHRPPVVLGHEEDQDWLTRTDLPAAGWVGGRVWRNAEGLMLGDLVEVPGPVADAVNAGAFKKVSCEFYDDFKDNEGRSYGPALRRVALLGAEIPKVKGLADLPHAQFSDGLPARRAARALKFAEGKPVASDSGKGGGGLADAVKKMLKDSGLSDKTIGMLDGNEELMASLLADLQGTAEPDPNAPADPNAVPAKMSEGAVKKFSEMQAALERQAKELEARQQALAAQVRAREQEEERRLVYTFCENLREQKRIPPAELDETDPRTLSLPQRLLAMDGAAAVHKFSEGGKEVALTARQLEMERLRRLPVVTRFAEKAPAAKLPADDAEARAAKEYAARRNKQLAGRG